MSFRRRVPIILAVVWCVAASAMAASRPLLRPLPPVSRKSGGTRTLKLAPAVAKPAAGMAAATPKNSVAALMLPTRLLVSKLPGRPSGEMQTYVPRTPCCVDWNGPDRSWWFRWDCADTRVASVEWQVSVFPFDTGLERWAAPNGLVARGRLGPKEHEVAIDFGRFAPIPGATVAHWLTKSNLGLLDRGLMRGGARVKAAQAKQLGTSLHGALQKNLTVAGARPLAMKPIVKPGMTSVAMAAPRAPPAALLPPVLRRTYFVRVIPLGVDGKPVAQASPTVGILYGQPDAPTPVTLYETPKVDVNVAAVNLLAYEPVRFPVTENQYRFVVVEKPAWPFDGIYHVGQKLYLNPYAKPEKSFWDKVGDAIGAAVNFVVSAVNWASNAYASVKTAVARFVAAATPLLDESDVMKLIDVGLVAVGIPPSLPNFDQLANLGVDYLAATLAEQAGVPPAVAAKGMRMMVDQMRSAASSGGGGVYSFIRLDPDAQYRPAQLTFLVRNPHGQPLLPALLRISDGSGLFEEVQLPIPGLAPGQALTVPVFLRENNDFYNLSKPAPLTQAAWMDRYRSGQVEFEVRQTVALPPDYVQKALGLQAPPKFTYEYVYHGTDYLAKTTKADQPWHAPLLPGGGN